MISFREKNYMYSYNKMLPKPFSTHLHKYYEFLYFVQGDATYVVEGVEYRAEDGDLFVTRSGELHSIAFRSDKCYERYFVQISEEYFEALGVDLLKLLREKPFGEKNRISHKKLHEPEIKWIFSKIGEYITERTAESDVLIKSYIIQLVALVNRALEGEEVMEKVENERVRAAKEYINKNLTGDLSLACIAENAFTDKYYLSHLFKKETGMSLKDYINMQKIALAKKLISQGAEASKIYTECGFCDYSSFYRAFKKLSGKSPSEFFHTG